MTARAFATLCLAAFLGACAGSRAGFPGTWESSRAAVGEANIVTTLTVEPGGGVQIVSGSEGTVPVVMKGTWEQSGEHRMTARFTERNTPALDAPVALTFRLKSGKLELIDGPGAGGMPPFQRRQ